MERQILRERDTETKRQRHRDRQTERQTYMGTRDRETETRSGFVERLVEDLSNASWRT